MANRFRLVMIARSIPARVCLTLFLGSVVSVESVAQEKQSVAAMPGDYIARLSTEAEKVKPLVANEWVIDWMSTASRLPIVQSRVVSFGNKTLNVDEEAFYAGRYGSPLAYARALDLAVSAGFNAKSPSRVFDFGYGSIGHLKMLALSGHDCVGVDVAPVLKAVYAEASGPLGNGSVQVLDGHFPKDQDLVAKVGEGFDLVISKNVLKLGYIHPTRKVRDSRTVIDLGVDDDAFLESIAKMLKPNGLFVIYNFCPAKAPIDKPYIPWAEGESPFSKDAFQQAGFEVLSFDVNDDVEARRLGRALKWDEQGQKSLDEDLFAWYTIVRKGEKRQAP